MGFVLAATGSAIGLGNIWKFPYITGVHGGGAFVLVYLACIVVVGLPLMIAELSAGKRGGKDLAGAMSRLAQNPWARLAGQFAGRLAVATSFLILAFYSVVAGWTFHFLLQSLGFVALAPEVTGEFEAVSSHAPLSALWMSLFMALTILVVSRGIHGGIERLCKWLMPALFLLLVSLVVHAFYRAAASEALTFLFAPKWDELSGEAVLEALGHAFFTLSLGMGTMVVYGSYLKSETHIVRDSLVIVFLDTLIALLAGIVIFSAVFQAGATPGSGPGLLFETLPPLFASMPAGKIVSSAFFLLVFFAAWSSSISMLEVVVAWCIDHRGVSRPRAAVTAGLAIWLVALGCAYHEPLFRFFEGTTGRLLLPLGGLLVALLVGWGLDRKDRESGFTAFGPKSKLASAWSFVLRTLTPALVVVVLLYQAGWIEL